MVSRKRNDYREMKIIDNFLDKEDFLKLQNFIVKGKMPWYFGEVICKEEKHSQFYHIFYDYFTIYSNSFDLLYPIITKLNIKACIRIKANLLTRTDEIIEHGYHTDYNFDNLKTAVFYCNTNNGYTKFKNGKKVESIENRIVCFDAKELHTGSTCTDEKTRVVININYYE